MYLSIECRENVSHVLNDASARKLQPWLSIIVYVAVRAHCRKTRCDDIPQATNSPVVSQVFVLVRHCVANLPEQGAK